jgi:hypothetical protein
VLDQVKRVYNGFGQLAEEYQEHHGEVAEGTSKKVQYAYQYINHDSRLQSVTYPSGFTLTYGYDECPGPAIGRVSSVAQDGQVLESYTYRGVDMLAGSTLPELGVTRTLQLDAFDRLQQIAWNEGPTLVAGYAYGHDPDNDLLWRNDLAAPDSLQLDEAYAYNGLGDQKSFQRGVLDATGQLSNTLPLVSWNLDSQGNRYSDAYALDYNAENESSPSTDFDAQGCETTIELASGATATLAFDAWNEATQITPSEPLPSKGAAGNAADAKDAAVGFVYRYDALGRQISLCRPDPGSKSGDGSSATTDKYYLGDQPVEELDENTVVHADRAYSPADGRPMLLLSGAMQRQYALSDGAGRTVAQLILGDTDLNVFQRYTYKVDGQPEAIPADFTTSAPSGKPLIDILDAGWQYQPLNGSGDGLCVDTFGNVLNPSDGHSVQPRRWGAGSNPYRQSRGGFDGISHDAYDLMMMTGDVKALELSCKPLSEQQIPYVVPPGTETYFIKAASLALITSIPGVGEILDACVLVSPSSTNFERALAGVGLATALYGGVGPNLGTIVAELRRVRTINRAVAGMEASRVGSRTLSTLKRLWADEEGCIKIGFREAEATAQDANLAIRQRVLANIAESQAARKASNFGNFIVRSNARSQLQAVTDLVNQRLAQNPARARTVLSAQELEACVEPHIARMLYGNAVERLTANEIQASPQLRAMFEHLGGPNDPDFIGTGPLRGMKFDITTPAQVNVHLARPYGPGMDIITYKRPAWLP